MFNKTLSILRKQQAITEITSECGRKCYIVKGEQDTYHCYSGFCSCKSFASLGGNIDIPYCKHLCAIKIAESLDLITSINVTDEDFALYCSS